MLSDAGVDYRAHAFDGPVTNAPDAMRALGAMVVAAPYVSAWFESWRLGEGANYCPKGSFGLPRRILMPTIGP